MKAVRPAGLNITAIPFRSSNLAIPPSPFSPRLPLTPPPLASTKHRNANTCTSRIPQDSTVPSVPPPMSPLNWVWQCHICRIRYPLGVTRRCLEDGHFFCAGTTVVRTTRIKNGYRTRVLRRHKACSSEFDYQGWNAWAAWRRDEQRVKGTEAALIARHEGLDGGSNLQRQAKLGLPEQPRSPTTGARKDCWSNCNYPSECRWGPRMQQQSPSSSTSSSTVSPSSSSSSSSTSSVHLPSSDQGTTAANEPNAAASEISSMELDGCGAATTFDGILENISGRGQQHQQRPATEQGPPRGSGSSMKAMLGALGLSASRRKSVGAPSPLTQESSSEAGEHLSHVTGSGGPEQDEDGDALMAGVDACSSRFLEDLAVSAGGLRSGEQMPMAPLAQKLPGLVKMSEQDIQEPGGQNLMPEKDHREKRKGYAGYVETLRKMNMV